MALAFYSTSYVALLAFRYSEVVKELEKVPQIIAFFKDDADEKYILQLKETIEQTGKVAQVRYVSKQDALKIYQERNVQEPELLEFVTADILPASLEISTNKLEFQEETARLLSNDSKVEKVIFQREVVENFQKLVSSTRLEGLIWATSLLFASVLTVLLVVGMNIRGFSEEIEIMRLVGASSWYIRWPFILDGIILGIVAAGISTGILYLMPYLRESVVGVPSFNLFNLTIFPVPLWFLKQLWAATTGLGMFLGALGATLAIWRHLRV